MSKTDLVFLLYLLCSSSFVLAARMKVRKDDLLVPTLIEGGRFDKDFQKEEYVELLKKAVDKADKDAIIDVTVENSWYQRQLIRQAYDAQGKDLIKDLKKKLHGDFEDFVVSLYQYPAEFAADDLYDSMHGLGTDEAGLNDILVTRSNEEIKKAKEIFDKKHTSLEEWIKDETNSLFAYRPILLELIKGERSTQDETPTEEIMKDPSRDGWGWNDFYTILEKKSFSYLKKLGEGFKKANNRDITDWLTEKLPTDEAKLSCDIFNFAMNPTAFFASRVRDAVHGLGTNERKLNRAILYRMEIDLPEMIDEYKRMYNKDMLKEIKSDTSGKYQKLFIKFFEKYGKK